MYIANDRCVVFESMYRLFIYDNPEEISIEWAGAMILGMKADNEMISTVTNLGCC